MQRRRHPNPIQVGQRVRIVEGQLRGLEGVVKSREPDGKVLIHGLLDQEGLLLRIPGRCVRAVEPAIRTQHDRGSV